MGTLIDSLVGLASPWLYVVVALLAAAESAALVGLVIPGEAALLVGGFAASQGRVSLPILIVAATVSAIVGDSIGYELGRHLGPRVRVTKVGQWVGEDRWTKAEGFIARRGGPAVLLGRWVGLLRALVPGVAGMTRMPYPRFLVWNVLGAMVWAPAVVSAGYFAGSSFKRVERWFGRASLLILAVALSAAGLWVAARWIAEHRSAATRVGARIRSSRVARQIVRAASPIVTRLQPNRAFLVVMAATFLMVGVAGWALAETFDAVVGAEGIARADQPVASWFDAHRTAGLTSVMRAVSTLGGGTGAVVVAALVGVAGWRRWGRRAPVLMAVSFGGALALSQAIKHLVGRTRPVTSGATFDGFAFPSGHTTVAVAVWGAVALVVATRQPWRRQVAVWAGAIGIGALVGFSRAYLGAHWLTDVIGGWLLGTVWIAAIVGADALIRRRSELRDIIEEDEPASRDQNADGSAHGVHRSAGRLTMRSSFHRHVAAPMTGLGLLAVSALGVLLLSASVPALPSQILLGVWISAAVLAALVTRAIGPSLVTRAVVVALPLATVVLLHGVGFPIGAETVATLAAGLVPFGLASGWSHPTSLRRPRVRRLAPGLALAGSLLLTSTAEATDPATGPPLGTPSGAASKASTWRW